MHITESFLKDIIIRHEFLQQDKLKSLCELQKKLKNNKLPKTLVEIFQYKKVFSENRQNQLQLLIEFFNTRIFDSVLCKFAIEEDIISQEQYEKSLITQRAIFVAKNKVLSLTEIFELKEICREKDLQPLIEKINALPQEKRDKLWKKHQAEIDKQDVQDLKWRKAHNNKDSTADKTEKDVPPSKLEKDAPPHGQGLQAPPSKLEKVPTKKSELVPPSQLEKSAKPSSFMFVNA